MCRADIRREKMIKQPFVDKLISEMLSQKEDKEELFKFKEKHEKIKK